ncbi:MAG TPA: right-handed parallel beta-helix repeat-containing protein [Bacteroidales bacterium]|nr:right-handed parallel beta-helix repeat-containing protein [Bacteroidales bacterium]
MRTINYCLISACFLGSLLFVNSCKEEPIVVDPVSSDTLTTATTKAAVAALTANYYVSLTGSNSNAGTMAKPFKTIEYALSKCKGTELIYVRGGTYKPADNTKNYGLLIKGYNGKDANNRIKIWAYPGERVVLDLSSMKANNDGIFGLSISANNIHIAGFDVVKMPQNRGASGYGYYNIGILIKGNNVTLENCTSHDNGGTGINIGGTATGTLLRNCDAYNNYDPYTNLNGKAAPGGNADGFHITVSGSTSTHKLVGCRAWNNSDDGFDCYGTNGFITIDSCWAFKNGYLPNDSQSKGDGSGIKLGVTSVINQLKKVVTHNLAAYNRMEGFTQNKGYVIMNVSNNTAYGNGSSQFDFGNKLSGTQITMTNNISVGSVYTPYPIQKNNSWNLKVTANADDFKSTSIALLKAARKANGNLPVNDVFRLKTTSDLKALGAF